MKNSYSLASIKLSIGGKKTEVHCKEIVYLESVKNYTICKLQDGTEILSSKPIGIYETKLKNLSPFVRTHRSFIINLSNVQDLNINSRGGTVTVANKELEISRRKVADFRKKYKDFKLSMGS